MEKDFKKPLLIGKVGKFPKKVLNKLNDSKIEKQNLNKSDENEQDSYETNENKSEINENKSNLNKSIEDKSDLNESNENVIGKSEGVNLKKVNPQTAELSYKEPEWSGEPDKNYTLEVLKSGQIVERINLIDKSYFIIGRLDNCDVTMAHPTISRYHAVLQFRKLETEDNPKGFYLYDLSSTHGTFLNKQKLKSRVYTKVYVGHMIKFGCSTRTFLLTGPDEDTELEDPLTVTELKQKRKEEIENRRLQEEELEKKRLEEEEDRQKKLEERGVDWGMGDDADEETDLSENPYAQTNNEELYLDDPKKALRGFFEREGIHLEYDCSEQAPGQFLCKVQLPLDDERGKPIFAEVLHKGRKKEVVVQCALEACRILDRHGVLRQATHESRKRKAKNWEENDFYDSDDDTFLDRTGIIEKKREIRMKNKLPQQPETYQSLVDKKTKLEEEIESIQTRLEGNKIRRHKENSNDDTLDMYMKELKNSSGIDKEKSNKLKIELQKLKGDLENVNKLLGIAKPTNLPDLKVPQRKDKLPVFGKRLKIKVNKPTRNDILENNEEMECENEDDKKIYEGDKIQIENEEIKNENDYKIEIQNKKIENEQIENVQIENVEIENKKQIEKKSESSFIKDWNKIESNFLKAYALMPHDHERYVSSIWKNLKQLHPEYLDEMKINAVKMFEDYLKISSSLMGKFANEIDFITSGIKLASSGNDVAKLGSKVLELSRELTHLVNQLEHEDIEDKVETKSDGFDENYDMWVPPENQTGDGRTSLNDKFGY